MATKAAKAKVKTKLNVLCLVLALVAAAFLLAPNGEAAPSPAPDGLYSAHVMNDSNSKPVYLQIRVAENGNIVVLGAGMYRDGSGGNVNTKSQLSSCLRTTSEEPANGSDKMYTGYLGEFDINAMYTLFKASTIYDIGGNTVDTTKFTFPGAITQIGHGAFNGWKSTSSSSQTLTSVIVPSSVTEIGSDAFAGSSITTVDFSQATKLTRINSSTFNGCESLTSVDLSNTKITRLETNTFNICPLLTSVKLPDTLETIENSAFKETYGLTQLTIPPNVNVISSNAFEDVSLSPKTKTLKFTGDYNSSFNTMATNPNKIYVKLLYPAGNPTWENSPEVQALVAAGKAASYIPPTAPTAPPPVPEKITPTVLSAPGQTITANVANNAVFLVNIAIGEFSGVWIDGSAISPDTYETRAVGENTEVTFKPWFVRSLAYGRHTIAFITIYNDIAGSYFFRG